MAATTSSSKSCPATAAPWSSGLRSSGRPAQPLTDHFFHAFGDTDVVDTEVGSPLAVAVLVDRAPLGEADEHLDREERITAGFRVYRDREPRVAR